MTRVTAGPLTNTCQLVDKIRVGTGTAPFPAQALAAVPTACIEVSIQCNSDSPESLFVGNVFGQHREVAAGNVEVLPARDMSEVYVMSLGGTATYNWIAGE